MINYESTIKVSMLIKETEMVLTWKRFSLLLSLNATQKLTAFGPKQQGCGFDCEEQALCVLLF